MLYSFIYHLLENDRREFVTNDRNISDDTHSLECRYKFIAVSAIIRKRVMYQKKTVISI